MYSHADAIVIERETQQLPRGAGGDQRGARGGVSKRPAGVPCRQKHHLETRNLCAAQCL